MNWKAAIATVALSMAVVPALSYGQAAGGGDGGGGGGGNRDRGGNNNNGGGGGGGGNRGNFDPAEFQRRQLERVKEQLKAPDDEWKVIEPKLQKVFAAQREAMRGGFGGGFGGGRRGGGGGGGGDQPQDNSEIGVAQRELRTVLERDATPEEVDKKLAAYRSAREKAQKTLESARKDLKEVLSAKQEAQLVLSGTLD